MRPFKVKVIAVKRSEYKRNRYFITVQDYQGTLKTVGTRNYKIGEIITIKKRNPVDNIYDIVKEPKKHKWMNETFKESMVRDFIEHGLTEADAEHVLKVTAELQMDKEDK